MNFEGGQYYKVNRILLTSIGLWPYYHWKLRYFQSVILIIILVSGIAVQCSLFLTREFTLELLLKIFTYCGTFINMSLKYVAVMPKTVNISRIMAVITHNWNSLRNEEERKILHRFTHTANQVMVLSTIFIYVSIVFVVLLQFIPCFLDIVVPLNESRPRQLPLLAEYFVDQQKYFTPIVLHYATAATVALTIGLATETATFMYVQHVAGMHELVCYRIKCSLKENPLRISKESDKSKYDGVIDGIELYKDMLQFTVFARSTFIMSYILLLPIGLSTLTATLYRCSRPASDTTMEEFMMDVLVLIGHFGYLFLCNYMGQVTVDHSTKIFTRAYDTDWYAAPVKVQKLLLFTLHRAMTGVSLRLGGLYDTSLKGFLATINLAMSYFMVIHSTR